MKSEPAQHIFLIGFSGSGKSTVGPILARRLKLGYHDTDVTIEKRARRTIRQIFAGNGERFFRELERKLIISLAAKRKASVIALGGGALQSGKNISLIKSSGKLIYLSCSIREICRRIRKTVDRPMLDIRKPGESAQRAQVVKLMNQRRKQYALADLTVSTTNRTPAQAVARIIEKLK